MARDLDGTGKDFARDYERKRGELGGCGRFGAADCCSGSGVAALHQAATAALLGAAAAAFCRATAGRGKIFPPAGHLTRGTSSKHGRKGRGGGGSTGGDAAECGEHGKNGKKLGAHRAH